MDAKPNLLNKPDSRRKLSSHFQSLARELYLSSYPI